MFIRKILNRALRIIGIYDYGYNASNEKCYCIIKNQEGPNKETSDYERDSKNNVLKFKDVESAKEYVTSLCENPIQKSDLLILDAGNELLTTYQIIEL